MGAGTWIDAGVGVGRTGKGVGVSVDAAVGETAPDADAGVAVAGRGVGVSGTGVAVDGPGVAVGGIDVDVGGRGVDVGGTAVDVGGAGVGVIESADVTAGNADGSLCATSASGWSAPGVGGGAPPAQAAIRRANRTRLRMEVVTRMPRKLLYAVEIYVSKNSHVFAFVLQPVITASSEASGSGRTRLLTQIRFALLSGQ